MNDLLQLLHAEDIHRVLEAQHRRRLEAMQNARNASEWVCRSLMGLPVELADWQKRLFGEYKNTEHARQLKAGLLAKGLKKKAANVTPRTLSDLRREDAAHSRPLVDPETEEAARILEESA